MYPIQMYIIENAHFPTTSKFDQTLIYSFDIYSPIVSSVQYKRIFLKMHIPQPPTIIYLHRLPKTHTDCQRLPQTGTGWHRLAYILPQTATDCQRLPQTATDCHRMPQTVTDCHRLPQTGLVWSGLLC